MAWDREKERKAGKTYHVGISILGLIFSIFWCCAVVAMDAWFMLIFGLGFMTLSAYRLVLCFKYGDEETKKTVPQETDPWEHTSVPRQETADHSGGYCPYCGTSVNDNFDYCPKCGRRLI